MVAALLGLVVGTYALRCAGLLLAHRRLLPRGVQHRVAILPAALLAALVVVQTLSGGGAVVSARLAGVAVGAVAVALRAPLVVVIALSACIAAGARILL